MSEKKSKAKKIIISIIIVVLIVATAITVFLVVRNNKNKKNTNNSPVENVGQSSNIEAEVQSDVINQKICVEYNGNYAFLSVMHIEFDTNMSISDKNKVFYSISNKQAKDENTFRSYLINQKTSTSSKEIITLVNGKYTKSIGETRAESGLYFGNLDKSIIFKEDENGSTIIDERNYSPSIEISHTGYWLPNLLPDKQNNTIYIHEKINYGNVGEKFIYVTYAYRMIEL